MNPFQLQAQFCEAWLAMTRTIVSSTLALWTEAGDKAMTQWTDRAAPSTSVANATSQPMVPWATAMAPQSSPMMQFPQFAAHFPTPAMFLAPWSAVAAWPSPWQIFPLPPMSMPMPFQWPFAIFPQAMPPMPWVWPSAFTTQAAWPNAWMAPADPTRAATELMDQMAATYRTATGHAVAAVVGPFGAPIDARIYGEPWWMKPPQTNPRRLS